MADMRLVVAGAAGRMGRMLVQAIHASEELVLAGALERKGSPALGQDIGTLAGLGPLGISITDDPLSALAHADRGEEIHDAHGNLTGFPFQNKATIRE